MANQINLSYIRKSGPTARAYLWEVNMTTFADMLPGMGEDGINFRATTVTQPQPETTLITTGVRGWDIKEAGRVTWNDLTFTLVETTNYDIYAGLYNIMLETTGPNEGKQTQRFASPGFDDGNSVTINLLNLQREPVLTWNLQGCLITGASTFPDLAGDKETAQEFSFTLSYQHATLTGGNTATE